MHLPVIYYILIFSKVVPTALAFLNFRRFKRTISVFILLFLVNSMLTDVFGLLAAYFKINSNPAYNIYGITEFILLSFFFRSNLKRPLMLKIQKAVTYVISSVMILDLLFFSGIAASLNGYASALESLGVVVMSFLFFIELALGDSYVKPIQNGNFYINVALFFYFLASSIYFITFQYALNGNPYGASQMVFIHAINYAISNIIITFGIWISLTNMLRSSIYQSQSSLY